MDWKQKPEKFWSSEDFEAYLRPKLPRMPKGKAHSILNKIIKHRGNEFKGIPVPQEAVDQWGPPWKLRWGVHEDTAKPIADTYLSKDISGRAEEESQAADTGLDESTPNKPLHRLSMDELREEARKRGGRMRKSGYNFSTPGESTPKR